MNIDNVRKTGKCTGCSACVHICPSSAIVIREDGEGFLSPFVDPKRCTHCGKCLHLCPVINANLYKHSIEESDSYIVQSKNSMRKKSASGGVFVTVADAVIKNGGVACGAAFDEKNVVRHIFVDKISDLRKLQNSKYVQSDIGSSYCLVKEYIEKGRTVLFSGTPCQIAGLYAYLGHDDEKLITIDIICHGCPSPKLLKRELDEDSKTWQGKVKRLSFRYKNPLFKSSSSFYMMMMMMQFGLPIVRRPADDPYFSIFSKGYGFRESCYSCSFASPDRVGDFTLGDCDSHRLYKDFHPTESNSTVIINTDKAKVLWNKAIAQTVDYTNLNIYEEIKYNKQLGRPSDRPSQRDEVYYDLNDLSWADFSHKYANKQTVIGKMRSYTALLMPNFIVNLWGKLHG